MGYAVDASILQETTHCKAAFACQKADWTPCKRITGMFADMLVENGEKDCSRPCSYRVHYADDILCRGPTRKAIYQRYGV